MPTELTRAKEVITELEINSKDLLAEYFTHRKFNAGIELFGENVLKSKINTSKTPKVYNLRKIQKSIEKDGDFYFKNTKEVSISIRQISYSQSGIFRVLYRKQHSQASFLKQVQSEDLLKYNTLEKVQMVAKYKEGTKTKSREFFIEWGKTNLSHDSIDTKIRYILRESGIQEITVFDVQNAFEYVIANNGLVNIYKAEKHGYEKQAFEILIESELLCVEGDVANLYCEVCKMDTMEVGEINATCTNCGCTVYLHEVDATNYKLNFQKLKEKLCEYREFVKDENSKEPSYLGYLKYGASGEINFYIVENAEDVQNIKKWGEQIVLYLCSEYTKENEKDLPAFPIIDYLSFGNHKIVGFDKVKVGECAKQYYKAPEYIKKQNISSLKQKISKDCIKIMEAEIPIFLQKPQYKDGGFKQELYIAVQNKILELHPVCKEKSNLFTQNIFNQKWTDVIKNTPEYSFLSYKTRRYSKERQNQI